MPNIKRYISFLLMLFVVLLIGACKNDTAKSETPKTAQPQEVSDKQKEIMKEASGKIESLIVKVFCDCQKETDPQKKADCDFAIKDIYEKMGIKQDPSKTFEQFKETLNAKCN